MSFRKTYLSTEVVYQPGPEEPASDGLEVASRNIPETPVLQSRIVDRKPEPVETQGLVVKEGAVLMRGHLTP